jgi:hypothetical protein
MKILKEDFEMLKEDLGILTYPVGLLVLYAITSLIQVVNGPDKGYKDTPGRPLPNENVINALNDMWDNKPFLKDFAKILSDEGDIDELAKQIRTLKNSKKPQLLDTESLWRMVNKTDFEPASVSKRIVQRLLNTSSYKGIVKKYKFTKEDEQYFAKLLLLTLMSADFTRNAKQYILKTIKPLPFLQKLGRNISAVQLTRPDGR